MRGPTFLLVVSLLCTLPSGCGRVQDDSVAGARVLVVGMDGLDPVLLRRLMDAGKAPHFQRLAEMGGFKPLATSMPPQSPVAWSNVIAGGEPGTHEIYDFIHRDPDPDTPGLAILPYLSTSTIESPAKSREISLGKWRIPLSAEITTLQRVGPPFWDELVRGGVATTIYRIPANYPAQEVHGHGPFHCLTGMGTPDLLGSYGEFTVFTPDAPMAGRKVSGGRFVRLMTFDHRADGEIEGPVNFLRKPPNSGPAPRMTVDFVAVRDPDRDLVKILIEDDLVILKQGEWSRWIQFEFQTKIPGSAVLDTLQAPTSLPGMIRFYVKQVHPKLELFATPVNIDPTRPANPISVPTRFAADLARATGLYFTTGIPQHTPEIQQAGLDEDQWLEKAHMILVERTRQFRHALSEFDSGFLFYYFGTPDLVQHIFWRDQDPDHPGRDPEQGDRYAGVIEDTYKKMDDLVGVALAAAGPRDTLIVMSDHGFTSFRWGFNLNTWLYRNGYTALRDATQKGSGELFQNVDWSGTRAYGLGLNGLYINQRGREKKGIVNDGPAKRRLLDEISAKLLEVRDRDGSRVIVENYVVSDTYPDADPSLAPDLIVGYARNYRASWATVLGEIPQNLIEPNKNRWSGDHCIAAHLVPGILVSNRRITVDDPALTDLAPTILRLCGTTPPPAMIGRPILE